MINIHILIKSILFIFISFKAFALSSSSYLIANSAIVFYEYDIAKSFYDIRDINYLNSKDLEKKLLTYINANSLKKASITAEKIIEQNLNNQEAWLVYLISAKLNNDNMPFDKFYRTKKNLNEKIENAINHIFFDNKKLKNNNQIANSIFEIINQYTIQKSYKISNYDYLLFYLSLVSYLDSNFEEVFFYKAQVYQNLDNYLKAEENYKKISKNHTLYLESRINIAQNKKNEKKFDEAEKDLVLLLESNKENIDLIVSLSDLYRFSKQYEKAILNYTKILNEYNIENDLAWRILYVRGICYERLENWKLAEKDFLDSLEINPDSSQVLNYLAYGWIERNIFLDKSLKMLETAYENNPDSHYILDSLAWAHFKKNNLNLASELMEEVINRAPGEAISIDHLGDIYFAMGRDREAKFMWKQAKDLATPEDNIIEKVENKLKEIYEE
tara:strand:- start:2264 stop:3595 length:1332 start_codon:yes stop_codon:yes gene_type:complete